MKEQTILVDERLQDENLTTEKYGRGLSMFNPQKHKDVKIWVIGTGGVGSAALICLTKMGLHCKTCDFDTVGIENTSSQMFGEKHIDMPKVDAIKEICKDLCDMEIETINDKYKKEDFADCQILVMAVDSNEVRQQIVDEADDDQYIIDAGQVKTMFNLWSFYKFQKPDEWDAANKEIPDEADETLCTEKATSYLSFGTASFIWATVANVLNEDFDFIENKIFVNLKTSVIMLW